MEQTNTYSKYGAIQGQEAPLANREQTAANTQSNPAYYMTNPQGQQMQNPS